MTLPSFVQCALNQLTAAGFEAFVVGGSVRDLLLQREPKDFDITTNATPEQIQATFDDTLYNNAFGTVVVRIADELVLGGSDTMNGDGTGAILEIQKDEPHTFVRHEIEITPYRAETTYSDQRHPDAVKFGVSLEEDLKRRDFTINAMATNGDAMVDLFNGQKDCASKLIRTVGDPNERFNEDALRMLRACRFAAQLDFHIHPDTAAAITKHATTITNVSGERTRDELLKILASDNAYRGIWIMHTTGLLQHIIPELEEGFRIEQNKHHIYTIFMHNLLSLQYAPTDDPLVRLAALLHDVGKARTKEGNGPDCTFHQHEHVGARMVLGIMRRLKFSRRDIERVGHLVGSHMFYYNTGEITDAGVRRLLKRIGRENLEDIMAVRIGDRMGSGCQKEKPFKLVELERRMRDVEKDPMDTTMLKLDGNDIMELTGLKPGREIGVILNMLLEDVLEDPSLNTEEYLTKRINEFMNTKRK